MMQCAKYCVPCEGIAVPSTENCGPVFLELGPASAGLSMPAGI